MKSSFLGSLNKKFIFAITMGFLSTSVLFMVVFTHLYTTQLQRERVQEKNKTERMLEIYIQNMQLKQEFKKVIDYKGIQVIPNFDYDIVKKIITPPDQLEEPVFLIDTGSYELRSRAMLLAIRLVGAGAILIILVMLALYTLMNYYVINPVENLVFASEKLAEGDLTARVEIVGEKKRHDEMKRLATAFNKMAENLQASLKAIELKEKFQQALIDAIPDGIRVINDDYKIITSNKAYQKYAGKNDALKNNVFCYQSSHKRTSPCSPALTTCPLVEIRKKAEALLAVQVFVLPDGRKKYVEVRAAPITFSQEANNSELLIVESIRDLTKDIRFSHQQKLSSIGLLATSVAHEMRNPLGSIRLLIDSIINRIEKEDMVFSEIVKYLKMINEQLVVCIDVTERLLKMGRFSSENLEKVNCCNAIKETISLLDYEAKKQGIKVKVETPEKPVYIMATESEFRIVIVNLVQNAFNAIDKDGEIEVLVLEDDNKISIKVADNGRGIEKGKISRIFEPFFTDRSKKASDDREGTGLGLTITKSIIEKFGGDIRVESKVLEGTVFEIVFMKKIEHKKTCQEQKLGV